MIHYISKIQIDIDKYNDCIKNSTNSRIYAYSWYLDCVTETWDVLVLNDYEAVMPLPKRTKYGITYVYQPNWIQQLGIFSIDIISEKLVDSFIKAVPKKIRFIDFYLNSDNKTTFHNFKFRTNYLLQLNKSYKDLCKNYNTNRKRTLKKALALKFSINKNGNLEELLSVKQSNESANREIVVLKELKCLIKEAIKLKFVELWTVYNTNQQCVAGVCWMKNLDRITYLYPVASDEAKAQGAPTLLIDEMIKNYSNTNKILDFEGSMVPGVAKFYKSFNAYSEEYYHLKKWFIF